MSDRQCKTCQRIGAQEYRTPSGQIVLLCDDCASAVLNGEMGMAMELDDEDGDTDE